MSGGIDSSVSAILLQKEGYEVEGVTFIFGGSSSSIDANIRDAAGLAQKLGIRHHVRDLREEFEKEIITYFIEEYTSGRTPFPCAYCNPRLKFKSLIELADELGCQYIATGHYVRVAEYKGQNYFFEGIDPDKDQTFFLWGLPRQFVNRIVFPLGAYTKSQVRDIARQHGFFELAAKKDSLGVCFVDGGDYRHFLRERGVFSEPGNFVDNEGNVLGRHQGIVNYTIGQRRGLGLNLNYVVFVSKFNLDRNEIVLSKFDDLYCSKIYLKDFYFIDRQYVESGGDLHVKVRYRLQLTPCELNILNDSCVEVHLLKSEAMIAPGQTAVFYHGQRLVGGGFIDYAE